MERIIKLHKTVAVALLACLLAGCASLGVGLESPDVKLTSLKMLPSEGLTQRFRLGLAVSNPNAAALPIRGMSYTLALNGVELVKGVKPSIGEIAPYSEQHVTLDASTDLLGALRFVNDLVQNRQYRPIDYRFEAKIDVGGLARRVTVNKEGSVPLMLAQ